MEFDCESSCLPPIPSGDYVIINKVNRNIKAIRPIPGPSDEYPIVATGNSEVQIWQIEHLGGQDSYEYHIIARPEDSLQGGPAVDMQNRLFAIPGAQPVVWVICGEFEEGSDRKKIYIIKKKEPETILRAWELENSNPGTQVKVIQPAIYPGPECLVKRVPEVFTWYIISAQR